MTAAERLTAIRASARRQARARGEAVHLLPAEVEEVRLAALAGESMSALAQRYGVPVERVRRCAHNKAILGWRAAPKGSGLPELKP